MHSVNTNRPLQFTPSYLAVTNAVIKDSDEQCYWENLQWEKNYKRTSAPFEVLYVSNCIESFRNAIEAARQSLCLLAGSD